MCFFQLYLSKTLFKFKYNTYYENVIYDSNKISQIAILGVGLLHY